MAIVKEVLYYNSFWLKQLQQDDATLASQVPVYPGGYPYNASGTFARQVIGIASFTAGSGYGVSNNTATTGGSGTGLTVDIISVNGGAINKIKIRNNGSGYSDGDVLTITAGTSGTICLLYTSDAADD